MFSKLYETLKFIFYMLLTLPRDIRGLRRLLKIQRRLRQYELNQTTVGDVFQQWVRRQPNKACYIYEDKAWTYKDVTL
jgi:solute carrier family 27 fatty acid transporter 1/4